MASAATIPMSRAQVVEVLIEGPQGAAGPGGEVTDEMRAAQAAAEAAQAGAEESEAIATQQAGVATDAADTATAAAAEAEVTLGLITAAAFDEIYPDIATGRAAVGDGEIFAVAGAATSNYFSTLYQRTSASTQVELNSLPDFDAQMTAIDDRIAPTEAKVEHLFVGPSVPVTGGLGSTAGYVGEVVVDTDGNIISAVGPLGLEVSNLAIWDSLRLSHRAGIPYVGPTLELPTVGACAVAYLDVDDKPYFVIDGAGGAWALSNGVLQPIGSGGGSSGAGNYQLAAATADAYGDRAMWWYADADVLPMFLVVGQSLALGSNPDVTDDPISTVPVYPGKALMPSVGVIPNGADFSSFADLIEQEQDTGDVESGGTKETICSGFANTLISIVDAKFAFQPQILMAVAAHGGTPYRGLQRGSVNYAEACRVVQRCAEVAAGLGKRLTCNLIIVHGEADNSGGMRAEAYMRSLVQWGAYLGAEVKAITGQRDPVHSFINQCNRQSTAANTEPQTPVAAFRAMWADQPHITSVGPIYDVDADSSATHPLSTGYLKMGTRWAHEAALAYYNTGWQPLHAIEAWFETTSTLRIQYNRAVTVDDSGAVISTSGIAASRGFVFQDGTASPPAITNVAIVASTNNEVIEITLASAPTGRRPRVYYANRNTGGGMGRLTGPRGCIREPTAFGNDALGQPAYSWAVHETVYPGLQALRG